MATAADYRKLAEECFEWVREARDESVRKHYVKLGQIWLECAARVQLRIRDAHSTTTDNSPESHETSR